MQDHLVHPDYVATPGPRGRFGRPADIAESTRWLFAWLCQISLLICLAGPLSSGHPAFVLLGLGAAVVLAVSVAWGFLLQRVPLAMDVVDALAICALALSSPEPSAAFGIVFAGLWYRALYGSTWRSLVRCALYVAGLVATLPLWSTIGNHENSPAVAALLGAVPIMFITVIVSRQLGSGLLARQQWLRRDAAVAENGSRLLGLNDPDAIRGAGWAALNQVCAATPGLRLVHALHDGDQWQVQKALGSFVALPGDSLTAVITTSTGPEPVVAVRERAALDDSAGVSLDWQCLSLHEPDREGWLAIGAPAKSLIEVMPAIRTISNQIQLALRHSEEHQTLTMEARFDSLTGLSNRASFANELAGRLGDRRRSTALHVLFLDLDDFKDVNDVMGHAAGDGLLVEVARRIRAATRPEDVCARLGGDEFAVILRDIDADGAADIAHRMIGAIGEPVQLADQATRVTASIGVATATAGIDVEVLVHQADVAMYAAKAYGKGRIQIFEAGLLQADQGRFSFHRELSAAAMSQQLVQPRRS